jgi:hypothetical protein
VLVQAIGVDEEAFLFLVGVDGHQDGAFLVGGLFNLVVDDLVVSQHG